jgi:hypothetical protein
MFRALTTERSLLPRLAGLDRIEPKAQREAAAYVSACGRTAPAVAPGLDSVPVRGHL